MKEMTLLFLRREDEVLLAMKKRGFGVNKWNGVGGKVESNESIEEALIRECREEIGVEVLQFKKVAVINFDEVHLGERKILRVHIFTGTKWNGEPIESEEMKPKWFKVSEVPYKSMWPDDPFWLPQVLDGKLIKAEFSLNDNDEIISKNIRQVKSL